MAINVASPKTLAAGRLELPLLEFSASSSMLVSFSRARQHKDQLAVRLSNSAGGLVGRGNH